MAYLTKRSRRSPRGPDYRPPSSRRGYTRNWHDLRCMILRAEPMCRTCKTSPAVEVDHIIPIAAGGTNATGNLQPLCRSCHARKTHADNGRGGGRKVVAV